MNRGSEVAGSGERALRVASMRPRFMNRGSQGHAGLPCGARSRFNEAPIHESGKYFANCDAELAENRFNEAPIHESGKSLELGQEG